MRRFVCALCIVFAEIHIQETLGSDSARCSCNLEEWTEPPPESKRFEYRFKCDFDVLDTLPSQQEFDAKYWNRAPVLIRDGAKHWPTAKRWAKLALYDHSTSSGARAAYFHTDDDWSSRTQVGNESARPPLDLQEFLCNHVCQSQFGQSGHDQRYIFDRDMFFDEHNLHEDVPIPHFLANHFDPEWHLRWSRYFLVSALGSGINFHSHTNAFNGLVYGRKRWFIYRPGPPPPEFKMGPVQWFETVYEPSWSSTGNGPGKTGLFQCMQNAGDLVYIPQFWWHATIALGEGIGTSGQYVRKLNDILANATKLFRAKQYAEARKGYQTVVDHQDEVEDNVLPSVLNNAGIASLYLGDLDAASDSANLALAHPGADMEAKSKARAILQEVARVRLKKNAEL